MKAKHVLLVLAIFIIASWTLRPASLKQRLKADGIELSAIPRPARLYMFGQASNRAKFYALPPLGEPAMRASLKRCGYVSKFGKVYTTSTPLRGPKQKSVEEVFTKGFRWQPLFDFNRVWFIEFEGSNYVCIDPDNQ